MGNLTARDWLAGGGVVLSLFGLVWQAAIQVGINEIQNGRLEKIEAIQRVDHDSIIRVQSGVDYLVQRAKEREAAK